MLRNMILSALATALLMAVMPAMDPAWAGGCACDDCPCGCQDGGCQSDDCQCGNGLQNGYDSLGRNARQGIYGRRGGNVVPAYCGQDCGQSGWRQDLFYNFYVPPGPCGSVPAQLYLSPRPTPPLVGHTYITYQPLMPHEFLYAHKRHYLARHGDGGFTRTSVRWASHHSIMW